METVAVVGIGRMGGAFARHLVAAGHDVVTVDPDPARGATTTLADLVAHRPAVVVLSLPTEAALHYVVDALAADPWPATVVETGTFSLAAKQAAAARLAGAGPDMTLLDGPVSGTSVQADAGDVVVYASGPPAAIERCRPVLEVFSRAVHDVGAFGNGTTLKLVANLLVGVHTVAAAEALALAERAGLDPERALDLLNDGSAQSRMLELRGPRMAAKDYGDAATIEVFRKDLAIIGGFAADNDARTPLLDAVTRLFAEAEDDQEDLSAIRRRYPS